MAAELVQAAGNHLCYLCTGTVHSMPSFNHAVFACMCRVCMSSGSTYSTEMPIIYVIRVLLFICMYAVRCCPYTLLCLLIHIPFLRIIMHSRHAVRLPCCLLQNECRGVACVSALPAQIYMNVEHCLALCWLSTRVHTHSCRHCVVLQRT